MLRFFYFHTQDSWMLPNSQGQWFNSKQK
uniref:Uncharacterized protein n=1 Tax=Anguilla anguilla TaxID=7936 RepID=A0A0E9Q5C5_ANGAN